MEPIGEPVCANRGCLRHARPGRAAASRRSYCVHRFRRHAESRPGGAAACFHPGFASSVFYNHGVQHVRDIFTLVGHALQDLVDLL